MQQIGNKTRVPVSPTIYNILLVVLASVEDEGIENTRKGNEKLKLCL